MAVKPQGDFHGNMLKRRDVGGVVLREILPGIIIPKHAHKNALAGFSLWEGAISRY